MSSGREITKICDFCGISEKDAKFMFYAGASCICGECVLYCYDMFSEDDLSELRSDPKSTAFPAKETNQNK